MGLIAGACGGAPTDDDGEPLAATVDAREGDTFRLPVGGMARVGRDGLLVAFRGVSTESRCPTDVTCVWEGDAAVRLNVTVGRMAWRPIDLHTGIDPRSIEFQGHTIRLVSLEPSPTSDEPIDPARYVATLRVD